MSVIDLSWNQHHHTYKSHYPVEHHHHGGYGGGHLHTSHHHVVSSGPYGAPAPVFPSPTYGGWEPVVPHHSSPPRVVKIVKTSSKKDKKDKKKGGDTYIIGQPSGTPSHCIFDRSLLKVHLSS